MKLQSAHYDFNIKTCISLFVQGLPAVPAFNSLRADLPRHIAAIDNIHDYGAFITLMEAVLELDTIFRPTQPHRASRSTAVPPVPPPPVPPSSSVVTDPSSVLPKKDLLCKNCKSCGLHGVGHIDATCFQPGGGMEGYHDEYMHNKSHVHAMLAESLEHTFSFSEHDVSILPSSSPSSPTLLPTSDDSDLVLPPIANLCITPFAINSDFREDTYSSCDVKSPPHIAFTSTSLQYIALLSLNNLYNALLDSGCMHHIVRDHSLFHNYSSRRISVGTANCSSLQALGTGDVEFKYPFGNRHVVFTLHDCLYAPSASINLLSVGALVEHRFHCLFSPGGITMVFYPDDHPHLPGLTLPAVVINRLSFFKLEFLSPALSTAPVALPALVSSPLDSASVDSSTSFPHLKMDSMLWHCCFGHIGMDATRAALMKEYVMGVHLDGSFVQDHCISCIIGKSPQKSYPYHGNRATAIGELLHMDLCGPFPVQAPHGEKYFFNILDDRSNWGFTFGLRLKSDAFSHYKATEAFLERSNGVVIKNVHRGGKLKLTAGKMGAHFVSKGIAVQRTIPYAHQQNGKSEHYVRTIEEGGQALLADSGLLMSFWLNAMLTQQYLVNRLPTSTLPQNLTPYELLTNGRKPDLSHL